MRKAWLILVVMLIVITNGQNKYCFPLDSPQLITANYGELRPSHFHAGIDFGTGGEIGKQVYSIREGYVSRLRVSPYGYGNCVYITHPDGKVSVYAHLNIFSMKIDREVKREMISKNANEIDYYPKPHSIAVKKNEIIGLSGNSGGSSGPHLHFEIRDGKSEFPLNPMRFLKFPDRTPPEITAAWFFHMNDTTAPFAVTSKKVLPRRASHPDSVFVNTGLIALGFTGFDRMGPGQGANNIYSVSLSLDGKVICSYKLDSISFDDSRFVNAFAPGAKIQRCFAPETFPPYFFKTLVHRGIIDIRDQRPHSLLLRVADEQGNTSEYHWGIRARRSDGYFESKRGEFFAVANQPFKMKSGTVSLFIPAHALYYSRPIVLNDHIEKSLTISMGESLPLHKPATVSMPVPKGMDVPPSKIILNTGHICIPTVRHDSLVYDVKELGNFRLVPDAVSPVVKWSGIANRDRGRALVWLVNDEVSGIGNYKATMNGQWVIATYDPRDNTICVYPDDDIQHGPLQMRLEVTDKVGNVTVLENEVQW